MTSVSFVVYGTPQPGGSKKAFVINGKARITDANAKAKPWKQEVAGAAMHAMNGRPVLEGPLGLSVIFYRQRPKGHYRISKHPEAHHTVLSAQGMRTSHPDTKPDLTKLVRALEDSLKGIVWRDDAQVVEQVTRKEWGIPECAKVEVYQLGE